MKKLTVLSLWVAQLVGVQEGVAVAEVEGEGDETEQDRPQDEDMEPTSHENRHMLCRCMKAAATLRGKKNSELPYLR